MKLKDIFELASPGTTSVQSIGKIEFRAFSNRVCLFKRNKDGKKCEVARIMRRPNEGWRLTKNALWDDFQLPHFGNLSDAKSPLNGTKTLKDNINDLFKYWGIRVDELIEDTEDEETKIEEASGDIKRGDQVIVDTKALRHFPPQQKRAVTQIIKNSDGKPYAVAIKGTRIEIAETPSGIIGTATIPLSAVKKSASKNIQPF